MKVFLSHARKDAALAHKLAGRLGRAGFSVWNSEAEVAPGDNWAKKIGNALEESELMVILLSPGALESDWLRQDIEFGLGAKKFEGRLFSVFVGPTLEAGKDMPWILLKLPHIQIGSESDFAEAVKGIRTLSANSGLSHSNA
jgi:TIR domain